MVLGHPGQPAGVLVATHEGGVEGGGIEVGEGVDLAEGVAQSHTQADLDAVHPVEDDLAQPTVGVDQAQDVVQ